MSKSVVMVAVLLLLGLLPACSHAVGPAAAVIPADGAPQVQDKAKQDACECCQKCKAAKSPIKSQAKEGPDVKDGCEDCCRDCGQPLKSAPESTPPEIIQKQVPSDIKETPEPKVGK